MTQLARFNELRNLQPTIVLILSRAVAFLIFMFVIYFWGYMPAYRNNSFFQFTDMLNNTIRAGNNGHPLMTYDPVQVNKLIKLTDISSGYYDMGWPMLVSLAVSIDKVVYGESYQENSRIPYKVVIIFNLITALLFLLPITPFLVSIGGLFALAISIIGFPSLHNAFGNFWGAAYTAIVLSILIATIGLKSEKSGRSVVLFGLFAGIMVGIAQFIRNEAVVTTLVSTAIMLGGLWLLILFYGRSLNRDNAIWESILRLARYTTTTLFLFIIIIYAMPFLVRGIYALTYQQNYAATKLAMHGDGHSLYMSLGFVSNPYNIAWRDNVAMVHSEIIRPGTGIDSPYYLTTLRDEWIRIAVGDPKLIVANMAAKLQSMILLILAMPLTNIFLVIFPVGLILSCLVVFRRPTFQRLFIIISFLGLASIAIFVPLFIHPFYSQTFQGVLLTTVSVLPFSLWLATGKQYDIVSAIEPVNKQVAARLLRFVALLGGIGLLGLVAFIVIQSNKQNVVVKVSLTSDPYQQIQAEGYRYDSIFNQLSVSDQENVIAKLKLQKTSDVLVPKLTDDIPQYSFFRPEILVFSSQQLHLISWFGVPDKTFNYKELLLASGFVRVCANCDPLPTELKNNPYELNESNIATNILGINDYDWTNQYRIITLPILEQLPPNPKWCGALQTIANLDKYAATFHLNTYMPFCFRENT